VVSDHPDCTGYHHVFSPFAKFRAWEGTGVEELLAKSQVLLVPGGIRCLFYAF
jgi:hypothetical protein